MMNRRIFGLAFGIPIAVASADAGEFDGVVRTISEIYALEALCPALKVNQSALSESATLNKLGAHTLQFILTEGRRLTPETMKEFANMPEAQICKYARDAYGEDPPRYLIDR